MSSDNKLKNTMYIFAGIGLLDALYLSWTKLTHRQVICGTYGGCETVNSSRYATVNGIPIALLGAAAFIAIVLLLFLEGKSTTFRQYSPFLVFGITMAGFLYSLYLTYLEIAVIHAICPYCVVSAITMTILFVIATIRLFRYQAEPNLI